MSAPPVAYLRSVFDLGDAPVTVSPGARGALGQIWRLDAGGARYALKEIFEESVTPALVDAELTFTRLAGAAGARSPASLPDRFGRYLVPTPAGDGWLRLYEWVDLRPVPAATAPERLGALLARLHRCAPPAAWEPDGTAPDPWYAEPPPADSWPALLTAARSADVPWATPLADRVSALPGLVTCVTPPDPAALVLCHRDLHPENVLADDRGELVVVDWGDLGPAEPGRELARVLFDWFCDDGSVDIAAMRRLRSAYVDEGGPGRLSRRGDFTMLIASRLNFLARQVGIALDATAEPRHRDWAVREIDEALRILPTPELFDRVLEM